MLMSSSVLSYIADGLCAIEILQLGRDRVTEDVVELRNVAETMLQICVVNSGRQGSIASNVGPSKSPLPKPICCVLLGSGIVFADS